MVMRRKFSEEFKREAVLLTSQPDVTLSLTTKAYERFGRFCHNAGLSS